MNNDDSGKQVVWLSALVFVVSVAAVVTLEVLDRPTTTVMALVGPVVAGLLVAGHVSRVTGDQNKAIHKIEQQTNGVLDQRIRTQTMAALIDAGVVTPENPPVTPPPTYPAG